MNVKVDIELGKRPEKRHKEHMYESAEALTDDTERIVISEHLNKPTTLIAEFTMKKARQMDVVDHIADEFTDDMPDYQDSAISFPKKGPTKKALQQSMKELRRIYTLTVECVAGRYLEDDCIRVIEAEEDTSLYDLHLAIQESVEFDNDHLFDFYSGRRPFYQNKVWFCEEDEWEDRETRYPEIRLHQVYPLKTGFKLYYLFDWGDMWIFWVRKGRKIKVTESEVSYPRVIERRGANPEQYPQWD